MFCIFCRRAISENAPFCPGCGKQFQRDRPLSITCQSCQAANKTTRPKVHQAISANISPLSILLIPLDILLLK